MQHREEKLMKRLLSVLFLSVLVSIQVFAFSQAQLELAHNTEFALSQRLQLDTVIARKSSNNRIVLSELSLRDLIPTANASTKNFYLSFNERIQSLQLIDIKRERLDYIYNENKKNALLALAPNALSVATMAITTGFTNPLGAIISVVGAVTSSATSYLSARSQANMENLRGQWELDDTEMEILNRLGMEIYEYKCQIALDYDIPVEMTLSTKDLEAFVDYSNDRDPVIRMIKIQNLDTRLEILPDYWRELALTAYELGYYEDTLSYIEKFEEIYCPIIYHDTDYAKLLMVKCDCLNFLNYPSKYELLPLIANQLLHNIETDDWETQFFVLSLYTDLYNQTKDLSYLNSAIKLYPSVIIQLGNEYSKNLESYISQDYKNGGLKTIESQIESAKVEVERAHEKIASFKGDKKSEAYIILEDKYKIATTNLDKLKDQKKEFERTANLMLPPSCDFLCKIMDGYLAAAEKIGENQSTSYKNTCNAFISYISPSKTAMEKYKSINYRNIETTALWNTVNNIVTVGLEGIGIKEITIEASLDSLQVSLTGAEQIIDKDDIEVYLIVDNEDVINCVVKDLKINIADDLNTSSISVTISGDYYIEREKKDAKENYQPSFCYRIQSKGGFFMPFVVIVSKDNTVIKNFEYNRVQMGLYSMRTSAEMIFYLLKNGIF